MSQSLPLIKKAFKTVTDMSATNYRFVVMADDITVADATAGAATIGIRQESPDASATQTKHVNVALPGSTSKLTAGGTITVGAYIKSDANGAGVATTTDTDKYGARALEAAVSGQVFEVLVENGMVSA